MILWIYMLRLKFFLHVLEVILETLLLHFVFQLLVEESLAKRILGRVGLFLRS